MGSAFVVFKFAALPDLPYSRTSRLLSGARSKEQIDRMEYNME
jgi:hypothetical protein